LVDCKKRGPKKRKAKTYDVSFSQLSIAKQERLRGIYKLLGKVFFVIFRAPLPHRGSGQYRSPISLLFRENNSLVINNNTFRVTIHVIECPGVSHKRLLPMNSSWLQSSVSSLLAFIVQPIQFNRRVCLILEKDKGGLF